MDMTYRDIKGAIYSFILRQLKRKRISPKLVAAIAELIRAVDKDGL